MNRQITYEIKKEYVSVREFLKEKKYPKSVRIQLKQNIKQVRRNGEPVYLYEKLCPGDELFICINETQKSSLQLTPLDLPLNIVYEDEDILIINKPAGLSIHPSLNHYEDSLANAVLSYYEKQGERLVFRCVNRLDKETSGLTIIAKNMLSGAILSDKVRKKEIKREYRAICRGEMEVDEKWHQIDAPIARFEDSAILRCVDLENGKPARTNYQVLVVNKGYSLLKLKLETGRTHQIRVHMKHIGHPLPGDYLYFPEDKKINRVPLHSYSLEFVHPITFEPMKFEADIPEDMKKAFYSPR